MEHYNAIKEAVENARVEGLTLDAIARAIKEPLDETETRALVDSLQNYD